MDNKYLIPDIEIIKFSKEDIITTTEDTGEDTGTGLPPVNPFG